MYHEAFETDTDMQKWDSGCWIRYKLFENCIEEMPTISPDEVRGVGEWTRHEHDGQFWANYCSVCFTYLPPGTDWKPNYCPSCGARMKGAGE